MKKLSPIFNLLIIWLVPFAASASGSSAQNFWAYSYFYVPILVISILTFLFWRLSKKKKLAQQDTISLSTKKPWGLYLSIGLVILIGVLWLLTFILRSL